MSEGFKQYIDWIDYDLKKKNLSDKDREFLLQIREQFIKDHPNWEGERNESRQRKEAERVYCLNAKKGSVAYNELTGFSKH